jgi:hypothetical protein
MVNYPVVNGKYIPFSVIKYMIHNKENRRQDRLTRTFILKRWLICIDLYYIMYTEDTSCTLAHSQSRIPLTFQLPSGDIHSAIDWACSFSLWGGENSLVKCLDGCDVTKRKKRLGDAKEILRRFPSKNKTKLRS